MAFFQRGYSPAPADQTFTNLFRLLDDFDAYTREVSNSNLDNEKHQKGGKVVQSGRFTSSVLGRPFNPRFDVRETENAYELHGELAGVDREDVAIEFTEPQTLVVTGRIKRNYSFGTPIASAASEAGDETTRVEAPHAQSPNRYANVSEEEAENAKERGEAVTGNNKSKEVAAPHANKQVVHPIDRYWVQERAVGHFHRTFNFPLPVDEGNVKASLENGILSISIPKMKRETRRIALQ